jgi:hypothetical protein
MSLSVIPMETTKSLILKCIFEQRLLTLKDMHEFNADVVFHIGRKLGVVVAEFKELMTWHSNHPINPETLFMIQNSIKGTIQMFEIEKVALNIELLGLIHTKKRYNRVLEEFNRPINELQLVNIHSALESFANIYDSELEEYKFLWLENKDVEKYIDKDPFKLSSHAVLNVCVSDSVCAARCLAFGQQTAAVIHLMRILEFATQEIGKKVGVQPEAKKTPIPINEALWGQILDLIKNQVADAKAGKNLTNVSAYIQADPDAYELLVYQFNAVRRIWRNPVAHPHIFIGTDPNNPNEGWNIFDAVKLFVDQLKLLLP